MITVEEALDHLFALISPLETEVVPLTQAVGRVLAEDAVATRDQPPFAASAMDGYAVCEAQPGDRFTVIGESAAGSAFDGTLSADQAVRIFTGAPVPANAGRIVIQEDVLREGDQITVRDKMDSSTYIRPAGGDFQSGAELEAPTRLTAGHVALLAAMNTSIEFCSRASVLFSQA